MLAIVVLGLSEQTQTSKRNLIILAIKLPSMMALLTIVQLLEHFLLEDARIPMLQTLRLLKVNPITPRVNASLVI